MRQPSRLVLALAFVLGVTVEAAALDATFTTIDFPGATLTFAAEINARGDIVGRYASTDGVSYGYLLSRGEFITIDVKRAAVERWVAARSTWRSSVCGTAAAVSDRPTASVTRHGRFRR
jgi:hypothetical protein